MKTHDVHCHFFSPRMFEVLAEQGGIESDEPVAHVTGLLGWDAPKSPGELADRWVEEMDRQ